MLAVTTVAARATSMTDALARTQATLLARCSCGRPGPVIELV
jgi:hypothetical protein